MLPFNISSLPDFTEFRLQDGESAVPWTNSLGVRYLHDTWFGKSLIKMKTFLPGFQNELIGAGVAG